jgi:hypothetical protein
VWILRQPPSWARRLALSAAKWGGLLRARRQPSRFAATRAAHWSPRLGLVTLIPQSLLPWPLLQHVHYASSRLGWHGQHGWAKAGSEPCTRHSLSGHGDFARPCNFADVLFTAAFARSFCR